MYNFLYAHISAKYVYTYIFLFMCTYVYVDAYIYIHVYIRVFICMCIYMFCIGTQTPFSRLSEALISAQSALQSFLQLL